MKTLLQSLFIVLVCVVAVPAQTAAQPSLLIQDGHMVNAVAFSRDGKVAATAGDDATIKLWDAENGMLLRTLYGHTSTVRSLAFGSDSNVLVSGSFDRTVKLWDVTSGNLIRTFEGHSKGVDCVDINQLYRKVVSSGSDGVRIWDTQSGRETLNIPAHLYGAHYVKFALNDRRLLIVTRGLDDSTSGEYRGKIWDAERGNLLRTFQRVLAISVSDDRESLAVALKGNDIQIYSMQSGSSFKTLRPQSEGSTAVENISLNGDGTRLAVLNENTPFVSLWEVRTGRLLQRVGDDERSPQSIVLNVTGTMLATTDADGTTRIWNSTNNKLTYRIEQHTSRIQSLSFNPDGSMIAAGYSNDSRINLWDVKSAATVQLLERNSSNISSISFSNDGQQVVSGGYNETFKLLNAKTGQPIRQFGRHAGWTRTVAFSPDGKTIASGSDDHLVKLWDALSGRLLHTLSGHNGVVFHVAFSPDGTTLVSAGENREINLWDVRTGSLRTTFDTPTSRSLDNPYSYSINSLAFSPDGKLLLSANGADGVKLWEVRTGRLVRTMEGHEGAFSPNNQLIATEKDGVIKAWDLRSGRFLRSFTVVLPVVSLPTFSPNSKLLIASNGDAVAVWSVATGALLMNLLSFHYNGDDQWLSYTPDGYYAGSTSCEKYVSWAVDKGFGLPEIHPASEYSKQFARPDLLIAKLSPAIEEEKRVKPLVHPRTKRTNRRP